MLSDETRVNEIVEKTAIKGTTDDPIIATLAIDAAKFKNVKGSTILSKLPALAYHEINKIDKDAIYKDIFVFYIQPINKDIKPFPIHFELHTSGAAPDFIDDLIHFINCVSDKNVNISSFYHYFKYKRIQNKESDIRQIKKKCLKFCKNENINRYLEVDAILN